MQFPITEQFKLSDKFLEPYKTKKPAFGFNGLGELVYQRTYSRQLEDGSMEQWWQTVKRVVEGCYAIQKQHIKDYNLGWNQPKALKSAQEMYDRIFNFKILPSGRNLWAMGADVVMKRGLTESLFNCCFLSSNDISEDPGEFFAQVMDFLMCGVGVGLDLLGDGKVIVREPKEPEILFQIPDDREGWVKSLEMLINSYFGGYKVAFDYSLIRAKGLPIKGFGGLSSGFEPLRDLHISVRQILNSEIGNKLSYRSIADIANLIGKAVVSGNVRRCLPKGTLVHTEKGLVNIENVRAGDMVYTSKGLYPVTENIYQGKQKLVTIFTKAGDLSCTANHKVAVLDSPYTYVWVNAGKLTAGDRLVFPKHIVAGDDTNLPEFRYEKPSHSTTCKDIVIPKLDQDLAWFFGIFHGNGYVYPNKNKNGFNAYVSVACSPDYPSIVTKCEDQIDRFGVGHYLQLPTEKDRSTKIRVQSKQLALYMDKFKQANKEIKVPDFVLQGTEHIRSSYLAGLFDSDGSSRTNPLCAVTTVYPEFAKQVQSLYASLGIPVRIKEILRENQNWKTLYSVEVIGEQSKRDFETLIGIKSIKFAARYKTYRSSGDYTYPMQFTKGINRVADRKYNLNAENITFSTFNRHFDPSNLIPIEVESVSEESEIDQETYDISVSDVNEFVIDFGVLVHNSSEILLDYPHDGFLDLKDYTKNPERIPFGWNSNNSVIAKTGMDYSDIVKRVMKDGDPGIYWLDNAKQYSRIRADEKDNKDFRAMGLNPCVTGDTKVAVADGRGSVTFDQLAKEGKDVPVYCLDDEGNIQIRMMRNPRITGYDQPVYEIYFDDGQVLKTTANHSFILLDGSKVEAQNLEEGQAVRSLINNSLSKSKFIEMKYLDNEIVYNGTVDDFHNYFISENKTKDLENRNFICTANCGEAVLESQELCNLSSVYPFNHADIEDYKRSIKFAYLYSKTITLLNTHWEKTNRVMLRNRRIGMSISGIAQFVGKYGLDEFGKWCDAGYDTAKYYDNVYSDWFAIPKSIKLTTIKPEGTGSLLAGATPGIHYPESQYYIRRVRLANNSNLIQPLIDAGYKVEPCVGQESSTMVVEIPVFAGENVRSVKDVSIWEQFSLAAFLQEHWSDNSVSVTISFDPETEGKEVEKCLEFFQYKLKAVSLLPRIKYGAYAQMPYEEITKEQYEEMKSKLKELDFSELHKVETEAEKYCTNDSCAV